MSFYVREPGQPRAIRVGSELQRAMIKNGSLTGKEKPFAVTNPAQGPRRLKTGNKKKNKKKTS